MSINRVPGAIVLFPAFKGPNGSCVAEMPKHSRWRSLHSRTSSVADEGN